MAINIQELKNYIEKMQGMYDVVRLVEPGSCHVVNTQKSGEKAQGDLCYTTWGKCERCSNCASYQAVIRNRVQEKTEIKDGVRCHVISVPAPVLTDGKKRNSYAIELVSYGEKALENNKDDDLFACVNSNEEALYVSIVGNKTVSDDIISQALLDSEIGVICLDGDGN